MKNPLVSIVIANWNGGSVFENCLHSLAAMTYKSWELIVVDNASTDQSQDLPGKVLKKTGIRLVENKRNVGFALANNQGFKLARGKYVLLLNNDTTVATDLLDVLVAKMEMDDNLGVIQPKIKMMDHPGYLDNAGSFFTAIGFLKHWGFGRKDSKEFEMEKEVFSAKGACMLLRKNLVDEIGLFDPDFVSYFEESDLCWRVWLSGRRVIFYPKTYIFHKVGFTIKRLDVGNINFHYYKNRITSLFRNLGIANLLVILPIHILLSFGISLVFFIRGKFSPAAMIFKAIWWNVSNLGLNLKKRALVQKMRKIKDSDFLPKLSRAVNLVSFYEDFKRVEKDIKS